MVHDLLRGCGVATVLTREEIALGESRGCRFIQAYARATMLHFVPSIVPSLKTGFLFNHRKGLGAAS